MMTHSEGIRRLQTISGDAVQLLHQLENEPRTAAQEAALRQLGSALKRSLQEEYDRIIPERTQRNMTLFEMTVYSPTIEEIWKETGITRLKVDGTITKRWREVFEAVVHKTSKIRLLRNVIGVTGGCPMLLLAGTTEPRSAQDARNGSDQDFSRQT
jgi:hypothetical protein